MTHINPKKIKKILVILRHNQIGDMIVSVPMYYALKKRFPYSKITILASKTNYPIPFKEINPFIDSVLIFDRSTILKLIKLIRHLRREKFDLAIVPSTIRLSTTVNIIGFLSNAKYRVGVNKIDNQKNKLSFLLNIKKNFSWDTKNQHQILRNLEIVEQIGCKLNFSEIFTSFTKIPEVIFEDDCRKFVVNKLNTKNLLIGIHPSAGKIQNIWSSDNFVRLIEIIYQKHNANFIITAGPTDNEIIQKIVPELENSKIPFILAQNYDFKLLMVLINQCDLFISNDTGVMHMAGLTDTILIGLLRKHKINEWAPIWKNKFYINSYSDDINDISLDEVISFCDRIINLIKYKKRLV